MSEPKSSTPSLQQLREQYPELSEGQVRDLARDIALFRGYAQTVAAAAQRIGLENGEAPFSALLPARPDRRPGQP